MTSTSVVTVDTHRQYYHVYNLLIINGSITLHFTNSSNSFVWNTSAVAH